MNLKRISFFRHAQSQSNAGGISYGRWNTPLTTLGEQQSVLLAQALHFCPDVIVTSPMLRSRQTATPIISRFPESKRKELPVYEFKMIGDDCYIGTTHSERELFRLNYFENNDVYKHYGSGSESFIEFVCRVRSCLKSLVETQGDHIIVITHLNFLRAILWLETNKYKEFVEHDLSSFKYFSQAVYFDNCSFIDLEVVSNKSTISITRSLFI